MDGFVAGLLFGCVATAMLVAGGGRRRPTLEGMEDATEARKAWRDRLARAAGPRLRPGTPTPLVIHVEIADAGEGGR